MSQYNKLKLVAIAVAALSPNLAHAQAYPSKPITVYSTFAPGTPQDLCVRALSEAAAKELGQPIIVDPKAGAAGAVTAATTANQKPDGYAVGITTTPAFATLHQMQKLTYDPDKDLAYILQLVSFPLGIAVKVDSPFKTWADVVAHAKANPGKVTYGTPGTGAIVNLGMLRLQALDGIQLTHVPHQGAGTIISAVLGNHIMLMATGTEWKSQVDAGGMRLLMMWTGERLPSFAKVPTLRESGYPFELDVSFGLFGPNGLDPAITAKLHDAFKKALETPSVRALINQYDMVPAYASGVDFQRRMAKIATDMKPIINQLGLARKD